MGQQAFGARENLHIGSKTPVTGRTDGLYANLLHKFGGGKTAAAACPAGRRENVVAAAGVIAEGFGAEMPRENGARRLNFFEQPGAASRKAPMFGCEAVDEGDAFVPGPGEENGAGFCGGGMRGIRRR